ncbi:hypothetical protein [Salmonella phage SSBI34]|nr:hypothetical protein [Salmonella phage SSBI34]
MYKPFEPTYKITLEQCSAAELDKIVRVTTAVIRGLNLKHITFKEVKQVFTMPDYKAASRLGLTVTSQGMYHDHDLRGPHIWNIAQRVGRTIADTVKSMKKLREDAKKLREKKELGKI